MLRVNAKFVLMYAAVLACALRNRMLLFQELLRVLFSAV